jgi:hypothetical protein
VTMMSGWLLVLCVGFCTVWGSEHYYWKEYTGVVPRDAIAGGRDAAGRRTFIGQAYIHGHGFYVAHIRPGVTEVVVPCYGPKVATSDVKILCSEHPEYFSWVKTSAKTFEADTAGLKVVIGAYDNIGNNGIMHVGRIFYQGAVIVGDVTPFASRKGNVQLWFVFNKVERPANFYEVLVVQEPKLDERSSLIEEIFGN